MRIIRHILVSAVVILSVVFLSSTTAKAQVLVNYLFLETVDSNGQPIVDAKVETRDFYPRIASTGEKGQVKFEGEAREKKTLAPEFTVTKPGYFFYQDFGDVFYRISRNVKVELLKIPQTKQERQALGNEQLKREFIWASQNGDAPGVRKLLKSGIDPNITTGDLRGFSNPDVFSSIPAIVYAAASGNGETVKTLLRAGASVRPGRHPHTDSILFFYLRAAPFRKSKPETEAEKTKILSEYEDGLKKLIESGASVTAGDYSNSYSEGTPLIVAVGKGYIGAVKILIDHGANPAALNSNKITPLMVAAQTGNVEIAKLLIDRGVAVNARDARGKTALLHVATFSDSETRIKMANLLLKSGADPNIVNPNGSYYLLKCETPLTFAVSQNDLGMVRFLIANKADVNLACQNGDTALKYAKQREPDNNNQEIIKLLEAAGAK